MAITYNNKNLNFPVLDKTKVFLEVEHVSDGNSSFTNINTPTYTLGESFEQLINQIRTLVSLLSLNSSFGGPTNVNPE